MKKIDIWSFVQFFLMALAAIGGIYIIGLVVTVILFIAGLFITFLMSFFR